jgi:hypothetical protein
MRAVVVVLALASQRCNSAAIGNGDAGAADLSAGPRDQSATPDDMGPSGDLVFAGDLRVAQKSGFILLTDTTIGTAALSMTSLAFAGFVDYSVLPDCPFQTVGSCWVSGACNATGASTSPSGGDLTITGGTPDPIVLLASVDGSYSTYTGDGPMFAGGETLTVTSQGSTVPAFTLSVTAPSTPTITEPTPSLVGGAYALDIDRGRDLAVRWSGETEGTVGVELVTSGGHDTMVCQFPAAGGAGTVPRQVLGLLPAGSAQLVVVALRSAMVTAGDYLVTLGAGTSAVTRDGGGYQAAATLK